MGKIIILWGNYNSTLSKLSICRYLVPLPTPIRSSFFISTRRCKTYLILSTETDAGNCFAYCWREINWLRIKHNFKVPIQSITSVFFTRDVNSVYILPSCRHPFLFLTNNPSCNSFSSTNALSRIVRLSPKH